MKFKETLLAISGKNILQELKFLAATKLFAEKTKTSTKLAGLFDYFLLFLLLSACSYQLSLVLYLGCLEERPSLGLDAQTVLATIKF